jgi:hypothetical protein
VRVRLASAVAVGAAALLALPSQAASPKPQIVDPAGDANAINGQTEADVESHPTPVDAAGADIRSVLFRTVYKRGTHTPIGMTVAMRLSDAPMPNVVFRVYADAATCDGSVLLEYEEIFGGTALCNGALPVDPDIDYKAKVTVKGSTITWSIPVSKHLPVGTPFSEISANSQFDAGAVVLPVIDESSTEKYFSIG